MRRSKRESGEGRLGCFLWILFAGLVVYAGVELVPVKFAASRFQDFMAEEAAFGSNKGNPQIVSEMVSQAHELDLPLTKEQVEIVRTRESITISAHYEVPINFFGQIHYLWKFSPIVERPLASPQ